MRFPGPLVPSTKFPPFRLRTSVCGQLVGRLGRLFLTSRSSAATRACISDNDLRWGRAVARPRWPRQLVTDHEPVHPRKAQGGGRWLSLFGLQKTPTSAQLLSHPQLISGLTLLHPQEMGASASRRAGWHNELASAFPCSAAHPSARPKTFGFPKTPATPPPAADDHAGQLGSVRRKVRGRSFLPPRQIYLRE